MNRLIFAIAIMITLVSLSAAREFYQLPTTSTLKDTDRIMIYQNSSGNKTLTMKNVSSHNITGRALKSQINTDPVLRSTLGTYVYFRGATLVISPVAP